MNFYKNHFQKVIQFTIRMEDLMFKPVSFSKNLSKLSLLFIMVLLLISCSSLKEHMIMKDAAAFYKEGKFEDAAKKFEEALRINPYRAVNYKHLGYCYWNLIEPGSLQPKDMEYTRKALDAFQKYLEFEKGDDSVQNYIINLYINQNLLDEGIKFYENALKESPNDVRIMNTLMMMYKQKGDFQKSVSFAIKMADQKPTEPGGYITVGALCWDRSRGREDSLDDREKIVDIGMKNIDKALSLDPNNISALVYKGLLYRQLKEIAEFRAIDEKDRRKKKELENLAKEYLAKADEMRNKALELKKKEKELSEKASSQ